MIIIKIFLVIVIIAIFIGIVSLIIELFHRQNHKAHGPYEKYIKRPMDAFLSTGALIVFSPILIITAILVRIKLGTPIIFSQTRIGKDEKPFNVYKFRTMTDDRDENGILLPDEIRLTNFGKKLRSTSIDELPELINIIRGDMAVIGPRPLHRYYLPWYTEEQHKRHNVRPGLTGYAQAHGRNTVDWDDKFRMDVEYASHITFRGDLQIILDTVKSVFRHEGINSDTYDGMVQKGNLKYDGIYELLNRESAKLFFNK